MQPYPGGAAFLGQPVEQLAQRAPVIEVEAIPGGVLADDNELFYTALDKCPCFADDVFDGS